MAGYTLKLSIYTFALKGNDKEEVTFKDFQQTLLDEQVTTKELLFDQFKEKFLNSFSDKFVLNSDKTKGIAIKQINCIPTKNIIDGMMIGGLTGIEQEVYKTSSSENKQETIKEDEITALPYYFKIWMPFNSDLGILMVQSYTEAGVVSLVIDKIKHFFRSYGYSIATNPYVHNEYKEYFKKNSSVNQLVLAKSYLSESARGALNQLFTNFSGLKVEIKISGFNVSIDEFWKQVDTKNPLHADLSEFEMNEKENYDVVATYKDTSGKQSQARLSRNLDILPTIILDDQLKETGKEYPSYTKIQAHTNFILEKVKEEIGYEAKDVE